MNILSIDTSSALTMVALRKDNTKDFCTLQNVHQSEYLMPKIDELLTKHNLTIKSLDYVGIVVGPGSFTGIRIAISIIKGFMCANKKIKAVVVNCFELMSYIINSKKDYYMWLDSGNTEPYFAKKNQNGLIIGYMNMDSLIAQAEQEKLQLFGFEKLNENSFVVSKTPEKLQELIEIKIKNKDITKLSEIAPVYIKVSQAEKELKTLVKERHEIKDVILLSDLVELEKECFGVDAWSEQSLQEELSQKDRKYFMAYYKGKSVGYIGLWQTDNDLNLLKIAVSKEFRRLGIASHLLNKAIEYKEKNNLDKFFLEVDENNQNAINLYTKFGFKTEYKRPKYYKNGDACLVMFYRGLNR